jgi:translation initiation factor 2 alpha subunit (eIF-2alpha)
LFLQNVQEIYFSSGRIRNISDFVKIARNILFPVEDIDEERTSVWH